jgi:RNA polymerase sigma-70 factor (ECF subfamily)
VGSASDADLVARCLANEQAAWEELVDRYARYVYAIAARVYRLEPDDAEDVFQEVFTRVFERLETLRDVDALRPWIAQTTRRCAVDTLRRNGREAIVEEPPDGIDEGLAQLDEAMTVHAALAGLSPECREILDRFFARDESYRTIGDELDLPSGTIASRISRCLSRLRDVLDPDSAPPAVRPAGRKTAAPASGEEVRRRR